MKPTFSSSSFPILINLLHLSNDTYIKQEGRTTFISPNQIYAWETELLDTKDRLFSLPYASKQAESLQTLKHRFKIYKF